MKLRAQVEILLDHRVEFIVVGGQAGVLRQAIEFSHDLDVLVRATHANALRVSAAVERIAGIRPDVDFILGRDFQQYVDPESGTEIDVHLKLIALVDYEAGLRHSGPVDLLGVATPVLELPALYASKRTDRPRDALHRRAIEDRLRHLVLAGAVEVDEVVLACCLDREIAATAAVSARLASDAAATTQGLLQARLAAFGLHVEALLGNPSLDTTVRSLLGLEVSARAKLTDHPGRLAALLARIPLQLPEAGYHVRSR